MKPEYPRNQKVALHLYHHERSGTIKLHRLHNATQSNISTLGEGYTPAEAEAVATLLNCEVEVIRCSAQNNDNNYLPTERQDELALENMKC